MVLAWKGGGGEDVSGSVAVFIGGQVCVALFISYLLTRTIDCRLFGELASFESLDY